MLILGIDPSLCNTGLAILDTANKKILYTRTIRTISSEPIEDRLHHIYGHIRQLIKTIPIDHVAIETQYMGKYASVLKIAMAYAVCITACRDASVPITHYTPRCIKKNTTGLGNADKLMIINAVKLLYDVDGIDGIDSHVADAIALAHVHQELL